MPTSEEYLAKAADALVQLADAKGEAEKQRLRRAHGVYLKLSTHGAEAAARAAMAPLPKIRAEKQAPDAGGMSGGGRLSGWGIR